MREANNSLSLAIAVLFLFCGDFTGTLLEGGTRVDTTEADVEPPAATALGEFDISLSGVIAIFGESCAIFEIATTRVIARESDPKANVAFLSDFMVLPHLSGISASFFYSGLEDIRELACPLSAKGMILASHDET